MEGGWGRAAARSANRPFGTASSPAHIACSLPLKRPLARRYTPCMEGSPSLDGSLLTSLWPSVLGMRSGSALRLHHAHI